MPIRVEINGAVAGLKRAGKLVRGCIEAVGTNAAGQMEAYAKQNRPWTDRTGNARRTMEGVCGWDIIAPETQSTLSRLGVRIAAKKDVFAVGVEGHMPYSVFLELSYGQRYAILLPTVNTLCADVIRDWTESIGQLK